MKIATVQLIADSLGIVKSVVSRDMVSKGHLVKNEKGKIDIEDPDNRKFLKSKGANFEYFYPPKGTPKPQKKKPKKKLKPKASTPPAPRPVEKPVIDYEKPNKKQVIPDEVVNKYLEDDSPEFILDEKPTLLDADIATKIERLKGIKKDNELKDLKLFEEKGRLIDRSIVQNIVFDVVGIISNGITSIPYTIVDELISVAVTKPDEAREKMVRIMLESNSTFMKKAVEEAESVAKKRKFN